MQLGFPKKRTGKVFKLFLKTENGKRGASSHLGQHAAMQRLLGPFFPTSIRSCERLAIMSARRHGTQKQHSQGPANNFEDCIKCFVLAAKVLLDAKQWYADTPRGPHALGKLMVKTFKLWERSQLHGTPSIQSPRGSRGTSRPRIILPVSSKALSSVGRWAKSEKLSMSAHWNIAWTTSWGKRKGSCTISSFCFLSNHTGVSAQYKRWPVGALSKASEQITRAIAIWSFVSSKVSDMVCPSSIGICKQGMGALGCKVTTYNRNKSDKLARKRLSGGKVPGS